MLQHLRSSRPVVVTRTHRRRLQRLLQPVAFKEMYINNALCRYPEAVYLEIGVRDGESFRLARASRRIGIDPERRPKMKTLKTGEEFYAVRSDIRRVRRAHPA